MPCVCQVCSHPYQLDRFLLHHDVRGIHHTDIGKIGLKGCRHAALVESYDLEPLDFDLPVELKVMVSALFLIRLFTILLSL